MDIKLFKKSLKSIVDGNPEKGIKGIEIDGLFVPLDKIIALDVFGDHVDLETKETGLLSFCGSPDMLIDIIKE